MNVNSSLDKSKLVKVSGSEYRFVSLIVLIVLIVTSLPYIYAQITTPPDKVFMGMMLDVPDHLQYFSWMRELTTANLAANKLTPEANNPVFFNLLWWVLGRVGKLFDVGFAGMFQVLRIVATFFFMYFAYRICAWYFPEKKKRVISFIAICFTSGLGWVLVLLKYTLTKGELLFPLDVFIAEGNTFLSILGYPHFIAALMYIFCFELVLIGEKKQQYRFAVFAGLFALFLGWQHAYDLISVYGVLGAYGLLKWLRTKKFPRFLFGSGLLIGLISCWPAIYSVVLTSLDPLWKEVLAQFENAGVFTPNLLHLPILLGFTLIIAVITVISDRPLQLREKSDTELFILGWFWVGFVLIYLPVDYQIHLINGWQIPIALLATKGLFKVMPSILARLSKINHRLSRENLVVTLFFLLIIPTNVYLFTWRFIDLSRHDYPYYLYKDEVDALNWLDRNAKPDDVILSSLTIGQYIPAYTGSHAYLAHWAQTVDYYGKVKAVDEFYAQNTTDDVRQRILQDKSVDYVFYGPAEEAIGNYNPEKAGYLSLVYDESRVRVFKVVENH